MNDLEAALADFRRLMLDKFADPRVLAKRGAASVPIDGNLDRLEEAQVGEHFWAEIEERLNAQEESRERRASADVDVANMAFLDWFVQRREFKRESGVR